MCRRVRCGDCGKPTWKGCGAHVEKVLANVPSDERCRCREQAAEAAVRAVTETVLSSVMAE